MPTAPNTWNVTKVTLFPKKDHRAGSALPPKDPIYSAANFGDPAASHLEVDWDGTDGSKLTITDIKKTVKVVINGAAIDFIALELAP